MTETLSAADFMAPARMRWRLGIGIVLLNLFAFGLTTYSLLRDRGQYEERVTVQTQNLAVLLEHDVVADFDRVRLLLDTSAQAVERLLASARPDGARLNAVLTQQAALMPKVTGLRLVDAQGVVRYGSGLKGPVAVDISAQEHYTRQRDDPHAGLVIAPPMRALFDTQTWVVPVSRRLQGPDGRFAGVLYASLPLDEFVQVFSRLDLGAHGVVSLRNLKFVVLARYPFKAAGHSASGHASASAETASAVESGQQQKTYRAAATGDHILRVLTLRRVADYPLYVLVGLAPRDYLDAWWKNVYETLALTGAFTLTSALFGLLLLRAWRRQWEIGQKLRESESLWSFALESGGYCVWDWNFQTGRVQLSKLGRGGLLGFENHEIGNDIHEWDERIHAEDKPRLLDALRVHLRGQSPTPPIEYRVRAKDGSWKWLLTCGMVVSRASNGRVLRMVGTHVDITERRAREEATRLAATVFDMADEGVMVSDANNRIIAVNPAFSAITGYAPSEVLGADPRILASGAHPVVFHREMWGALTSEGHWRGEIVNRRKSGEVYVAWLSIKAVLDAQGQRTHYVSVFSDITARKESEQRLHHLALHDPLTDLPNRTLLAERLEQAIVRAKRERTRLAVLYFDLDRFKPVNDDYGHAVGDLLLREVACRVLQSVRASDTLARLGGDEFVVLLSLVGEARDALVVAEKIRVDMARPFEIDDHVFGLSASIGVVLHPEHGEDNEALLRHADAAMYDAKRGGRNRVSLYRPEMLPA